jgi:hypothetical protein
MQFGIDPPARKVINNSNGVAFGRQLQRGGPAAKAVPTKNSDFFGQFVET